VGQARPTLWVLRNRNYLFSKVHFSDIFHLLFGIKVAASFVSEGSIMGELNHKALLQALWNDLYGEGGAWVWRSRVFLVFSRTFVLMFSFSLWFFAIHEMSNRYWVL
jgi:hypothetical protein